MNARWVSRCARSCAAGLVALPLLVGSLFCSPVFALTEPVVLLVRRVEHEVVVTALAPPGAKTVTLESRERAGARVWIPRAVVRSDGAGGEVVLHANMSAAFELLRVRAGEEEPLPDVFYSGTNAFAGELTSEGAVPPGGSWFFDAGAAPEDTTSREVEESDIYKLRDDTLFFFNQYRGLQVIDVADPDAPAMTGVLALPAAGEQMYLLGDAHVVLLVRSGCYATGADDGEILVAASPGGVPEVVAGLPVTGQIQESRLVGTVLYVASQFYRPVPGGDGSTWEWGTAVSSFDLGDPAQPVARDTLWFAGYGNVVHATDRYFFVVTREPGDWRRSVVHTIDISDPAGAMFPLNTLRPQGRVPDQFKLHVAGDVFTVISQVQTTELYTKLETFSFADPGDPRKLGELTLGLSERLHATRFAGDLVYVVTFFVPFQLDPLFVVDLADPSRPVVRGELEIPGWSTFLHPRGDQLVAVGVETNQTTVSLFDVSDPDHPGLLSRVRVGDGWSWSEANADEKAFNVLEEEGLILLPFQTWTSNGYLRQVQLIDLEPDTLIPRGAIDHAFAPRRATVHRGRILSLSGWELLTVDFDDRDDPVVVAETELAWAADRVVTHGGYIVEVENGDLWWSEERRPLLRVVSSDAPHAVLDAAALGDLPVTGITRREDRLYVVQSPSQPYPIWTDDGGETSPDPDEVETAFALTVVDLAQLPALHLLGGTVVSTSDPGGGAWRAVWPREDLVVWAGGGFDYGWWGVPVPLGAGMAAPDALWWPWWGGGGGRLVAFDVAEPTAPVLVSEVDVTEGGTCWSFGDPFAAGGLVYLSHRATEFVEGLDIPGWTTTYEGRPGVWMARHYMDVVDYTDATDTVVRPPVNIPGQLRGLGRDGRLLYTVGYRYDAEGNSDWTEHLDVSAYDGAAVYHVDGLPLSGLWPHPVLAVDPYVLVGVPGEDYHADPPVQPNALQVWTVPDTGRFTLVNSAELARPASQLREVGGMPTVRDTENNLVVFDGAHPEHLRRIGMGHPPGCTWYDLGQADADPAVGVVLPLGAYGVHLEPVAP